jgi:hypothetical protein
MDTFDLTKTLKAKEQINFEPISTDYFETSEDARAELERAEAAYYKYKRMIPDITGLNLIIDPIQTENPEWELMTEDDHCEDLDHYCTMDIITMLKKHIHTQLAKMFRYCKDLEATAEDLEQQERDDEKYGSYEDQVRSDFYGTR